MLPQHPAYVGETNPAGVFRKFFGEGREAEIMMSRWSDPEKGVKKIFRMVGEKDSGCLGLEEFKEGSERDETIVSAGGLLLGDGSVWVRCQRCHRAWPACRCHQRASSRIVPPVEGTSVARRQ